MDPSPSERDRLADERDRAADERDRKADERDQRADERDRRAAASSEPSDEAGSVVSGDHFGIDLGRAGGAAVAPEPDTPGPTPPTPKTLTERLAAAANRRKP